MTHAELETELPFFLSGTASPRARAAVEAELATCEPCNATLAEMRALGEALREIDAAAPGPSPYAFADTLERIAAGDAAATVRHERSPRDLVAAWWATPGLRRAGGGLAVALLVVLFFVSRGVLTKAPSDESNEVPAPLTDIAAQAPAPAPAGERFSAAESRSAGSAPVAKLSAVAGAARDAVSTRARQLARDGTLGLLVPDVPAAIARSEAIAAANFGLVTGLEDDAPTAPGEHHTAHLTISVPDDRFGPTIDRLAALGGITARAVKTEDLTDSIVDSDARLRNLRREERDLLAIMDRSGKVSDILDVEQQLADTRRQIEELDAQAQSMRRRVAYATIELDFSDEKAHGSDVPGPALQISAAWQDARQRVWAFTLALIDRFLVLVAFLPYLVALVVLGYVAYRLGRRFFPRRF